MKNLLISLLVLLLSTDVLASYVAVLETGVDGDAKNLVSLNDRQFLTNVLREEAVKQLPAVQNYTIMTRENIMQMLPPGKAIEDCEGSCLVETGKNIAADYVCQARVGSFDGDLTLSAELYETAGNKLIASFNGSGASLKALLAIVRENSVAFFGVVKNMTHPVSEPVAAEINENKEVVPVPAENVVVEQKSETPLMNEPQASDSSDSVRVLANEAYHEVENKTVPQVGESIPANVGESAENASAENVAKKSGPRWVVFGISAAATVAGALLAVAGNSQAKKAAERNSDDLQRDLDEAKTGQTLRSVGIGVAIAGAVGIGFSFVF
ncbi:hypothetical protein [Fibrobacter sp.]|uniref:hypothetical protein n=1 Tax=Fibrobacter sp. TaxID=35828 RepID=UPI0025C4B22F|nr:hypothetical protein [Fibrobacter sp.]MBR3072688.1 hypothetical protein [Fibrobacter sp.]